jgi:cytochrome P450
VSEAPDIETTVTETTVTENPVMVRTLDSVPLASGRLPLLGHALALWRSPLPFLCKLHDSGEMVRVDFGTLPVYFVTSARMVHELLVTQGRFFDKGRFFERARTLVGNGLATSGGETHLRHRRLIQPMFHRQQIENYVAVMAEQSLAMTESWQHGETVAVDEGLYEFAMSTLVQSLFSSTASEAAIDTVRQTLPVLTQNALLRAASPAVLDRLPLAMNRKFDAASSQFRAVVDDLIAASRLIAASQLGAASQLSGAASVNLMSMLLAARDVETGEALSDLEIRDEVATIMFGGTETTSSMLAWAYYEIARHPEVEQRLHAEIDEVVGTRPIRMEDIPRLSYTDRVLKEVCRMHGITFFMRRATQDIMLGDYLVPSGTEMGFSIYSLHHDPQVYPDPYCFDVDRWLPERASEYGKSAFIPFGAGTRKCIGDSYAWTAMLVNLTTVSSRWHLRLGNEYMGAGQSVREVAGVATRPDALPMTVHARTRLR